MKIVINKCYGGFGLSHEAMMLYFEIKGIPVYPDVYPEDGDDASNQIVTYWPVKEEDRVVGEVFPLSVYDIERTDPALVKVVEQLGDRASGCYSQLVVVEIPDDVKWMIQEYDGGIEWIAEEHRTWG
jgi:hypothetical protein